MKSRLLIPVLVLPLTAALFSACGSKEKTETASTGIPAPETAIAVHLTPVRELTETRSIRSSGIVATETESRLSFKVPGIISKIYVKEGDPVTKGQVLATLDLTEINAQVELAVAQSEKMKRDFERGERLFKDSALTLEVYQNLQTGLKVAEENLRIARFNRQYAVITAPATGKVIRKFMQEGELTGAGTPVLQVNEAGSRQWIVRVGLPDRDWLRVHQGDAATIQVDAWPEELRGVVTNVNEGAEPGSGLYTVEVTIQGNRKLASGMVATVTIVPAGGLPGKLIPADALVEGNGHEAFIFVPDQNNTRVRKIRVKIGHIRNDSAFIVSGLDDVREIIHGGSGFLTENSTITLSR